MALVKGSERASEQALELAGAEVEGWESLHQGKRASKCR
jgi:hypothetical protein